MTKILQILKTKTHERDRSTYKDVRKRHIRHGEINILHRDTRDQKERTKGLAK